MVKPSCGVTNTQLLSCTKQLEGVLVHRHLEESQLAGDPISGVAALTDVLLIPVLHEEPVFFL